MNRLQERKSSMYNVVSKGLESVDKGIIELIPRYKFYEDTLKDYIKKIETYREKQERNNTGTALLKTKLKEKLITSALKVGRKITAYAIDEENNELQQVVNYTKTKLMESADAILRDRCQIIHDTALEQLQHLGPYGVTKPIIEDLRNNIESFKTISPEPRLKITTKKDATDELGILFSNTDKHLKKMDKVFEMLRDDHYEFYRNYKNNRILINPVAHQASIIGTVKDASRNPIPNVVIIEEETGLRITTGLQGSFRIKKMKAGNYEFHFTKNGLQEEIVKVAINDKEVTEVNVIMQVV